MTNVRTMSNAGSVVRHFEQHEHINILWNDRIWRVLFAHQDEQDTVTMTLRQWRGENAMITVPHIQSMFIEIVR